MKTLKTFTNYSVDDVKRNIIERNGWGSYFIIEDFLDKSLFERLCADYNFWKKKDKKIWTGEENPRVWIFTEDKGINLTIGGSGTDISYFRRLSNLSKVWGDFIKVMYSKESYNYFINLFSDTNIFKKTISKQDLQDGHVSCKLSAQTNNYGFIIHPDGRQKLVSYLLYLDKHEWGKHSTGGTDLWEIKDSKVDYSHKKNSIDYQMRDGRFWTDKIESVRLTEQEAEKVSKFKSIDFKPNRLVGFVRSENSYHSIPPRVLPNGVTRDCFQINIWNLRSRKK